MIKEILSVNNARVKQWAALSERKHRDRTGLYVIDGLHMVQEALACGAPVETVLFDMERGIPDSLRAYAAKAAGGEERPEIAGEANWGVTSEANGGEGVEWVAVSAVVLAKCADTVTPQSVCAIVRKRSVGVDELLGSHTSAPALVVAVDGVQDPGNLGTIIRSADAVGATGVVLGRGTVDLYNAKTVRSTMGSLYHVPVVEGDLSAVLPLAREAGAQIVTTRLEGAVSCYDVDFACPTWIVVGNEGQGVSEAAHRLADIYAAIPMRGQTESLNVAMATTVLLFEAMRQRRLT